MKFKAQLVLSRLSSNMALTLTTVELEKLIANAVKAALNQSVGVDSEAATEESDEHNIGCKRQPCLQTKKELDELVDQAHELMHQQEADQDEIANLQHLLEEQEERVDRLELRLTDLMEELETANTRVKSLVQEQNAYRTEVMEDMREHKRLLRSGLQFLNKSERKRKNCTELGSIKRF